MVGQRLGQVVAEIPAQAEPVGDDPQQLALGAQPLEEQDQLQLEEDDRVDGGSPGLRVGLPNQVAHEAEIERALQMAVEVVRGNEVLQRDRRERGKDAGLRPHHDALLLGHHGSAEGAGSSHRAAPFFNTLGRFCDRLGGTTPGWQEHEPVLLIDASVPSDLPLTG